MNLLKNKFYLEALEYIASHDLASLETGKHVIDGEDLFVNIIDTDLKTPEQARFEVHRKYIDIQIPFSGPEAYGILPKDECKIPDGEFDPERDILFFKDSVAGAPVFTAQPGQLVVFTPEDAHAPMIGAGKIHKAIFKVKA